MGEKFYNYFEGLRSNVDWLGLKKFWQEDFLDRKKEKKDYLFGEVVGIATVSGYAALTTRYPYLERIILAILIFKGVVGSMWFGFVTYYGLLFILSILANYPPLASHLKELYGPDCLKRLRCEGLFNAIVKKSTFTAAGIIIGALDVTFCSNYLIQMDEIMGLLESRERVKYLRLFLELEDIPFEDIIYAENINNFRPIEQLKSILPENIQPVVDKIYNYIKWRGGQINLFDFKV